MCYHGCRCQPIPEAPKGPQAPKAPKASRLQAWFWPGGLAQTRPVTPNIFGLTGPSLGIGLKHLWPDKATIKSYTLASEYNRAFRGVVALGLVGCWGFVVGGLWAGVANRPWPKQFEGPESTEGPEGAEGAQGPLREKSVLPWLSVSAHP